MDNVKVGSGRTPFTKSNMQDHLNDTILDRYRPKLTTTIYADKQGAARNYATVSQRPREETPVSKHREKTRVKSTRLRLATLNVGTTTGKIESC